MVTTSDCRVDFIKNSTFNQECIIRIDQQLNLETIKSHSYFHINSLTREFLCLINKCQLIKSLEFDSIIDNLNRLDEINSLPELRMLICPSNVDERSLSLLLASCPNLETLIIKFSQEGEANHGITGECFKQLGPKIRHLILGNLVIKNDILNHLINSSGRFIQEIEVLFPLQENQFDKILQLSNLRKLTFKACYCYFSQFQRISALSNLESLDIERIECENDTLEELFSSVFQNCRKLKQFKISGTFKLYSHKFFDLIKENQLQLTHLHIYPNMHKLRWLHSRPTISDSICSLNHLQSLGLPYSNLTDSHLQSLLSNCPDLTVVDLSYCQSITSANYIVTHATRNPHQEFSVFAQSTNIKILPDLPENLKLCICDCDRTGSLPLQPSSFYDLI